MDPGTEPRGTPLKPDLQSGIVGRPNLNPNVPIDPNVVEVIAVVIENNPYADFTYKVKTVEEWN